MQVDAEEIIRDLQIAIEVANGLKEDFQSASPFAAGLQAALIIVERITKSQTTERK